jgi:hypothetical protein
VFVVIPPGEYSVGDVVGDAEMLVRYSPVSDWRPIINNALVRIAEAYAAAVNSDDHQPRRLTVAKGDTVLGVVERETVEAYLSGAIERDEYLDTVIDEYPEAVVAE